MLAHDFIVAVAQFGFRALQRPGELGVRVRLAGVNLRSLGVRDELNLLAGGNGDRIRDVGCNFLPRSVFLRGGLGVGAWGGDDEEGQTQTDKGSGS